MEERHVVTAFLVHGSRVALFRRSEAVATYRGRWAGVSGSLEAGRSAEEQMWQEVAEETGLSCRDVWRVARGQPLEAVDAALNRKWVVHPFLLRIKDPTRVRLDWEHSEMKWVAPEEIATYPTVPRLWETWQRAVQAEDNDPVTAAIWAIAADREHGAAFLAGRAAEVFALAAARSQAATVPLFLEEMENVAGAVAAARPTMAPLAAAGARWLERLRRAGTANIGEVRAQAQAAAGALKAQMEEARRQAAAEAARVVRGARYILTTSYSATVAEALLEAHEAAAAGGELGVFIAAAGEHGERLAAALRREGVAAEVFAVEEVEARARAADLALVGADGLLPDGSVVNGVPTLALAQAAAAAGIPFYVVADSFKYAPGELICEEGFERVPAALVSGVISEKGVLPGQRTAKGGRMSC